MRETVDEAEAPSLRHQPLPFYSSATRNVLHEHPRVATGWPDPWMERLVKHPRVINAMPDHCECGLAPHVSRLTFATCQEASTPGYEIRAHDAQTLKTMYNDSRTQTTHRREGGRDGVLTH